MLRVQTVVLCFFLVACGGSQEREEEYLNRAQSHFSQHNFDKTRVELKNVLQINPKNSQARYLLALLAEESQDWRKMYGILLDVVKEKPDFLDAQNKLSKLFLMSGQLDKALDSINLVLEKSVDNQDALILKAAILLRKEAFVESESILQSVLAKDSSRVEAVLLLAKQYADSQKYVQALGFIENGLLSNPKDFNLALYQINYLVALKSFQKAEKIFLDLTARFPEKTGLYYNLAKFYIAWGDIDQGEKVLRQYIESKPNDVKSKLVLAEFLREQRGKKEAEKTLRAFINQMPQNYDLRFALVKIFEDEPVKAVHALYEIIELDGGDLAHLKANNLLAMFMIKQGHTKAAHELLDDILKKDSSNSEALMLRSNLLIEQGEIEQAIADLRVVIRDNPSLESAFMLSAKAHLKSGFFDLAEESLEEALIINPKNMAVRKNLARLLIKHKDEKGAIKLLEETARLDHKDLGVLSDLVGLYINQKSWDKAVKAARSIPDSEATAGLSSYKLAQIYFAQKKYPEAVKEYIKIQKIKPLDISVLTQLSKSYFAVGEPNKSEALLRKLVKENPSNAALLDLQGVLYRSLKQFDKAKLIFEKVVALDRQFVTGYRDLASIYSQKNDLESAIRVLKRGLVAIPGEKSLLTILASIYGKKSDMTGAMDTFEQLLRLDAQNDIVVNNLAALIANTSSDPQKLQYALALVEPFKNHEKSAFLDTYGWLNYLNGNYETALITLEKVVSRAPDLPEFAYHLGMIYIEMGRTEEAKLLLEKSVTSGSDFVGLGQARSTLAELK